MNRGLHVPFKPCGQGPDDDFRLLPVVLERVPAKLFSKLNRQVDGRASCLGAILAPYFAGIITGLIMFAHWSERMRTLPKQ